jgi:4-alpha-glucanotransferase
MNLDSNRSDNPAPELADHLSTREAAREIPLSRRRAGLLVPVFAMRHKDDFGVGDTRAVRETIDFCAANSFAVLQLLPIHETFSDHSPYNPISSRALSPAYIYLNPAEVPGLLSADLERAAPEAWLAQLRTGIVKHGSVHPLKIQILQLAWHRFLTSDYGGLMAEFREFTEREKSWLDHYTLFRLLIREYEGNTEWLDWRPEHRTWQGASDWILQHPDRDELENVRNGYAYAQWIAHRQWSAVKDYADSRKVMLMGDIAFGVGRGSSDVWGNPELFDLDWNMGSHPLVHFDTSKDAERWGQNWNLPSYRWENHRSTGFAWLRSRVLWERQFFHICRLDHLRGYFRAYMFPWPGGARHSEYSNLTDEDASLKTGGRLPRFVPGPDADPVSAGMNELQGREIISVIRDAAGPNMADYMSRALNDLPLANLVFPQLEQGRGIDDPSQLTLRELSLVTYANHDNAPLASAYLRLQRAAALDPDGTAAAELEWLLGFAGWKDSPPPELDVHLLHSLQSALLNTPCKLAVLMCSDLLGVPLRFNLPGSYGIETWCDRLDFPLADYEQHAVFGPRIAAARKLIQQSGRAE